MFKVEILPDRKLCHTALISNRFRRYKFENLPNRNNTSVFVGFLHVLTKFVFLKHANQVMVHDAKGL